MRVVALSLVAVLVLAGCSASPTQPSETRGSPTESPTDQPTETPVVTATPEPTPTPEPYPSNHWDEQLLVVGLNTTNASTDKNYTEMVREATAYWQSHSEQYAGYPLDFRVEPDHPNPDIIVNMVEDIETCGLDTDTDRITGCAALLSESYHPHRPEVMKIQLGLTYDSTAQTMKHEFGHLLGLRHGEEPMPLMNATNELVHEALPNAVDRSYPWQTRNLTVYIDDQTAKYSSLDRDKARDQIQHAVHFYDSGRSDLKPSDVSIQMTNNKSEADIIVQFTNLPSTGNDYDLDVYGYDLDVDSDLEYYSQFIIKLDEAGDDEDLIAYRAAWWMGSALGADSTEDLPAPIRDAEYQEASGEWWE